MRQVFQGFPKEAVRFLSDLERNNDREWFEAHRSDFETHLMDPARGFVLAMGEQLREISPGVVADPRTDKSIFRIHRDTRFSKDKSPYKTHLGIFLWEGKRPKMECPGFYFHLEPRELMLGVGLYMFPKTMIEAYRRAVVHPVYGKALAEAVESVLSDNDFTLGGKHYKRVPAGFDADHPNAELLLHNGLHAGCSVSPLPSELFGAGILDYCLKRFEHLLPLHRWLVGQLGML